MITKDQLVESNGLVTAENYTDHQKIVFRECRERAENEVAVEILDRAIAFYEQAPTGQYDDVAMVALISCKAHINNQPTPKGLIDALCECEP